MHLNLISFNVPYPADYGGAIDVFYKIKSLSKLGVKIHLHCYTYGRAKADVLDDICESVNYYTRPLNFRYNISTLPFIVNTRSNKALTNAILANNYPTLFEGLHTTYPLLSGNFANRITIVRTHNIEHNYYSGLASTEKNPIKKTFFTLEALKLKHYERILSKASAIAAIAQADLAHFKNINKTTRLVTPFQPFEVVDIKPGKGDYVLMHGDLSVPENIKSILWILQNIAPAIKQQLIVAGKNPNQSIREVSRELPNVKIVENPNDEEMENLVTNAHINLIHSFFPQGFKLKLLYSLYKGRFCLCNSSVVQNTGLANLCNIAEQPEDFIKKINSLFEVDFDENQIVSRERLLEGFSNELQGKKIIDLIWNE